MQSNIPTSRDRQASLNYSKGNISSPAPVRHAAALKEDPRTTSDPPASQSFPLQPEPPATGTTTTAMHWSKVPLRGTHPTGLRAHTATVVGNSHIFVFGGCDANTCFADLWVFDVDGLWWKKPKMSGTIPKPCRAHSASLLKDRWLMIFGGGDGPNYFNSLYVLDTKTFVWFTPATAGTAPGPRRAHTSWVYDDNYYIYAGGDGAQALNDLYMLSTRGDAGALTWTRIRTSGATPSNRGYHTSNLISNSHQVVLFGGSDGHECFSDVHVLNLRNHHWTQVPLDRPLPRLSHTAVQVGSYLFVLGGHDGARYGSEALLLNLVTMCWETRPTNGRERPDGRGYHTAVLLDSRVWIMGGYDGNKVFEDLWALELSSFAYLPQITTFDLGGVER
ncbi:hypothetical protein BC832DRAFT_530645 [Gaertneriomyces semiglobifer]|nr:hypothetical protein BC832DRAFT_530645 [Gaertneriomyces semiglobifer]